jgi:hypothetical protein
MKILKIILLCFLAIGAIVVIGFNKELTNYISEKRNESKQRIDNLNKTSEELMIYGDCIISAATQADMKKCEDRVSPETLAKLKANGLRSDTPEGFKNFSTENTSEENTNENFENCKVEYNSCTEACSKLAKAEQTACYKKCDQDFNCDKK